MAGRQAKLITTAARRRMLTHATYGADPLRDQSMILLSVKAGLRAAEIAGLEWAMVLDTWGRVADSLSIENRIAKKGGGRRIPMHADLRAALSALQHQSITTGLVIRSSRGGAIQANSIVNWFVVLFHALDMLGCSSHSGRRTFITTAARNAHRAGCSLRDVQLLAGHRSIETTQGYIDGDSDAQHRLIALG